MDKKYELTSTKLYIGGHTLKQIIALRDFGIIKAGQLGGYIESENNLSHDGDCWVFNHAAIFENAVVCESAVVGDYAVVHKNAIIKGNANVFGQAVISGSAIVSDECTIAGSAIVMGFSVIKCNAKVRNAYCKWFATFGKNAMILSTSDYIALGPIGSRRDYTTFYKTKDGDIWVSCGCFNGSLDDFRLAVKHMHKDTAIAKDYYIATDLAEAHILHAS